jgi:hypothetical protein
VQPFKKKGVGVGVGVGVDYPHHCNSIILSPSQLLFPSDN